MSFIIYNVFVVVVVIAFFITFFCKQLKVYVIYYVQPFPMLFLSIISVNKN